MPRNKVNKTINEPIGQRLEHLVVNQLGQNWVGISAQLGYSNSSTLHKIKTGDTSISAEKLFEIAKLSCPQGTVNLHWLITGIGPPFLPSDNEAVQIELSRVEKDSSINEDALAAALINILKRSNQEL